MEPLTILVLEDHPFQRRMIVQQLQLACDCHILEAGDGQEALNKLRESDEAIDIALCDLMMEGMNGAELMRHLAGFRTIRSLVILSAMDEAITFSVAEVARSYHLPLLGNLPKPLTRQDIDCLLTRYRVRTSEVNSALGAPRSENAPLSRMMLQQALEGHWFELHYQPKIDTATARCRGVEALVRCRLPGGRLVMPSQFISQMEQCGLERQLSSLVLEEAISQASQWFRQQRQLVVAVNVSLYTLQDVGFIREVEGLLKHYGLPSSLLIIEVTETAFFPDKAPILESLARLRMLGVRLSIDDFGTGYSSLLQLSQIPFTELKIDQAFIRWIDTNERFRAIVSSSIQLATALGMTAVAEGVEREEQVELLTFMGCERLQGYLFGKPMPLPELEAWLEARP